MDPDMTEINNLLVKENKTEDDMQKIKMLSYEFDDEDKIAIIGALELYLDFINIFIDLLRIFGKRD